MIKLSEKSFKPALNSVYLKLKSAMIDCGNYKHTFYAFSVQARSTHLTDVTVHMEAAVQSHYPDRLLLTLFRHDGLGAH